LEANGVSIDGVQKARSGSTSFQQEAEAQIRFSFRTSYYPESRVRQKLTRWELDGVPGVLDRRVLRAFCILKEWCPPRVMTAYFRTVWNGWVTDYRMRTLQTSTGVRQCVLGCGRGSDQLEHYATCSVFWEFATKPCPRGLGLHLSSRSRNTFLLVNADQSVEDRVKMDLGIYAIHRPCNCFGIAMAACNATLNSYSDCGLEGPPMGPAHALYCITTRETSRARRADFFFLEVLSTVTVIIWVRWFAKQSEETRIECHGVSPGVWLNGHFLLNHFHLIPKVEEAFPGPPQSLLVRPSFPPVLSLCGSQNK
jgi:hypothetical protein